jgi:secernin
LCSSRRSQRIRWFNDFKKYSLFLFSSFLQSVKRLHFFPTASRAPSFRCKNLFLDKQKQLLLYFPSSKAIPYQIVFFFGYERITFTNSICRQVLLNMCDTLVAFTPLGMIFGKNSDRDPNEVQNLVQMPPQGHLKGETVKCTYIEIPQVSHTNGVLLSQPFWMWGAEMGVNEFGVAIGNETLFTKVPPRKENKYLTGMDLLRLGLERGQSAREALDVIISLLEQFGQGGNCGFNHSFYYNNSFLIADKNEAYVLETVDRMWAWKRITTYWAISNGISLTTDYDAISKDLISFAVHKKWCKSADQFNFQKNYSAWFMTKMARAHVRRAGNFDCLVKFQAEIGLEDVMTALRSHGDNDKKAHWNPLNSKLISVCAHASGLTSPSHTTNSLVLWMPTMGPYAVFSTASSTVCTAIYQLFFAPGLSLPKEYKPGERQAQLEAYWWKAEQFARVAMNHYSELSEAYFPERTQFEQALIRKVVSRPMTQADIEESFDDANRLMDKYYVQLKAKPIEKKAKEGQRFWQKFDNVSGLACLDK